MIEVPAIHVRNVPADVVERLKERAKRNGRSVNAEILDLLERSVEDERAPGWFLALEDAAVRAVAPDLFFVEVANPFGRLIRGAQLKHEEAQEHLELLQLLPLDV